MIHVVLDANVALDWHLQTAIGNAYSLPLRNMAARGEVRFLVPEHFTYEVSRILVIRALKGDKKTPPMGAKWLHECMAMLESAPIDTFIVGLTFGALGKLSETFKLDAPDVPYFHMARENELPIATRDKAIMAACKEWHVPHWQP